MAVTSKREQILEYIRLTILPKIIGTGNYNLKLTTISREFRAPNELKYVEFPAAMILDDYDTYYEPLTSREYTTGSTQLGLNDGMNIAILGMVNLPNIGGNNPAGTMSTEMNKMESDIIIAFFEEKAQIFGGLIQGFTLMKSSRVIQIKDNSQIGVVIVNFTIKYDFNPYNKIT